MLVGNWKPWLGERKNRAMKNRRATGVPYKGENAPKKTVKNAKVRTWTWYCGRMKE